jgi:PAS domain S-box-containing protein
VPKNDTVAPGGVSESHADSPGTIDVAEYQDALARLRRVYSFLNMTNEAIARIKQPEPLFNEACRIAVEVGGFVMAWIGLVDPESRRIKPVSHCGFEEGYLDKVSISADGQDRQGLGPTGIAARTGEVNICRDFAGDPRMAPWREEALKRGYCSSAAFPLRIGESIVGALTLYASETDFFDDELVELFKTLADDISFAIDAMRKDELRRRAEEDLALRAMLLDTATDSILEFDAKGNFVYANEASWSTLGYSREEFMNINLWELATPEFAPQIQERLFQAERFGRVIFESGRLRKDGSTMPVEVHIRQVDASGRRLYLSVARDITERKRAEQELNDYREHLEELVEERTRHLRFLNEEMESFNYSVSHDLRSPLRVIEGFSNMLFEDLEGRLEEDDRESFQSIFNSVKRMDDIIEGLLRLAHAGRRELDTGTIEIEQMVTSLVYDLKPDPEERKVEFVLGELPPASGDPVLVRQVFTNLLSNALKFTRERDPAVIEVRGQVCEAEVVYQVRDNGTGFDEEQATRLFKVFQRLHRQDLYEGTGVGLALVKRIAHRHGGRVWAEGRDGEGATFYLALPLADEQARR